MALLKAHHLKRYKDISRLLMKLGQRGLPSFVFFWQAAAASC
ncbi:MAG TPA: hypothetical protein V6D17_00600 [Candidatus Obscuribacterales bacterium]